VYYSLPNRKPLQSRTIGGIMMKVCRGSHTVHDSIRFAGDVVVFIRHSM
jgi:hypothetical protein